MRLFNVFSSKLNTKFYIISILLCVFTALCWCMVYSFFSSEILIENKTPSNEEKCFFILLCIVLISWTISSFSLLRQIISGYAFCMDENGIHSTSTAIIIFSLVFVIPVRTIPYSSIERIEEEKGALTLILKKSEIDVFPPFRLFMPKRYHLFYGFTMEKHEIIKKELNRFIKL